MKTGTVELAETYKGYDITIETYITEADTSFYVVTFCGDEVVHESLTEARAFIDAIAEEA